MMNDGQKSKLPKPWPTNSQWGQDLFGFVKEFPNPFSILLTQYRSWLISFAKQSANRDLPKSQDPVEKPNTVYGITQACSSSKPI